VRHGYLGPSTRAECRVLPADRRQQQRRRGAQGRRATSSTPGALSSARDPRSVQDSVRYEILQSDADREMPERASVITTLFPGDRDLVCGCKQYEMLRLNVALVNGPASARRILRTISAWSRTATIPTLQDHRGPPGPDLGFWWVASLDVGTDSGYQVRRARRDRHQQHGGQALADTYTSFSQTRLQGTYRAMSTCPRWAGWRSRAR